MTRRRHATPSIARLLLVAAAATALFASGCGDTPETTTTAGPATTAAPVDTTGAPGTTEAPSDSTTSTAAPGPGSSTTVDTSAGGPVTTHPAYTPAPGDPVRNSIMDAQRAYLAAQGFPSEVVFMVDWLRVQGEWAYSVVRPQSPDGSSQYEGLNFILRDRGTWRVVDVFGIGGEFAEDLDPEDTLRARNPDAPAAIFP